METKPNKLDLYVGPTGAFFMLFGHVHIELEPFRLNFCLMEIKSKELNFHEWSLAPPRVACGSQRMITTWSSPLDDHSSPQLSHPLTQHTPQQN